MYRFIISKLSYKICFLLKGGYIFFKGKEKYVQKNKIDGKRLSWIYIIKIYLYGEFILILKIIFILMKN